MKGYISILLSLCLMLVGAIHAAADDEIRMINQRARSVTPWLVNYQFQTIEEAETGRDSGEGCQRMFSIGISPVNPDYMLYSLDTNMLFRSEDGGKTWENSYEGFVPWAAGSIVFHPTEEQTAFCVGTGPNNEKVTKERLETADKIGVYKTTDAGKTWKQILHADMFINYNNTDMLLAFDAEENLYALSDTAIYKSKSPYTCWQAVYTYNFESSYDLEVSDDGLTIAVASAVGLHVSFDGGQTWENRTIRGMSVQCLGIDIDPRDEKHWIASFGSPIKSVFESFDYGKTWLGFNTLKKNVDNSSAKINFGPIRSDGSVWIYARNVVTPAFSYSSDNGKTWNRAYVDDFNVMRPADFGSVPQGMAVNPQNPDEVFFSFGDRVYKSADGGQNFKWSSSGSTGLYPICMKRDAEGKLWLGTADQALLHTTEKFDGTNYPTMRAVFKTSRYTTAFDFDPDDPEHMIICFAQSYNGKLMESFDGGKTFSDIPDTKTGQDVLVKYHSQNHDIIYTTSYISRDGGKNWSANEYNGQPVKIHSVSDVNPDIVWGVNQSRYICVSRDAGQTWKVVFDVKKLNPNPDSTDIDYTIKQIVADVEDEKSMYFIANSASLQYGVMAKYDGKTIRVMRDPQGETGYRFALVQNPKNPEHLLVSYANAEQYYYKSNGVYESYDGGNTWNVIPGIPGTACIRNMMWDEELDIVYMGGFIGFYIYTPEIYQEYRTK